jgi:hypothetical protein
MAATAPIVIYCLYTRPRRTPKEAWTYPKSKKAVDEPPCFWPGKMLARDFPSARLYLWARCCCYALLCRSSKYEQHPRLRARCFTMHRQLSVKRERPSSDIFSALTGRLLVKSVWFMYLKPSRSGAGWSSRGLGCATFRRG